MIKGMFGFARTRILSALTLVGPMGLALCLVSALAYADTIGGHAGHGWPNAAVGCFQGSYARMFNIGGPNCSDTPTKTLVIPLYIRSTQVATPHIYVRASGNGSSNVTTCVGIRNDQDNNTFFTASVSTSSTSLTNLDLGYLSVPTGFPFRSILSVECNVPVNGSVQGVEWTQ